MTWRIRDIMTLTAVSGAIVALASATALRSTRSVPTWGAALTGAAAVGWILGAIGHRRIRRVMQKDASISTQAEPLAIGIEEPDRVLAELHARWREERQRAEALAARLADFSKALSAVADGVLLLDPSGCVLDLNDEARRILELGEAPVTGRPAREVVRHAEMNRAILRVLRTGQATELVADPVAAEHRAVHVHVVPVAGGEGRGIGAVVTLRDITRLRALERVRQDFAANASHELRTPVTAIRGFAESLTEMDLPQEARPFVETIIRNATQLESLIRDLLTLAEIEHEQTHSILPRKEWISAQALFMAVEDHLGPAARTKRINMVFSAPPELRLYAVPTLLERAVINLAENAVRYSESGTRVEISARTDGPVVYIAVRDQGPGIAPEHLDRIFERFYRVDRARSRRQGGTGLGLAIVRHAVEAQGGAVSVQSTVGKGSVFTITLPHPEPEAASPPAVTGSPDGANAPGTSVPL